jgi:hypothetical protein
VYDSARQKAQPLLLDPTGPVRLTATEDFTAGSTLTVADAGFGTRLENCKLYVLDGPLAGKKATILRRLSGSQLELEGAEEIHGITEGTRLGISPVFFRWVGHQLGVETDDGMQFASTHDWFYTRHVDALACAFSDVDGGMLGNAHKDARYRAVVYRGNESEPLAAAFPLTLEGEKVESIENGLSTYYAAFVDPEEEDGLLGRYGVAAHALFPGVEVFVPGLDFRLLSVKVTGNIRDSQATGVQRQ